MRLGKLSLSPNWLGLGAAGVAVAALWLSAGWWLPAASALAFGDRAGAGTAAELHDDHEDSGGAETIRLSEQARGTIGLRTAEVRLTDFDRAITVPGVVAERPGRSNFQVAAPMTGVVTDVFVTEGQAVRPGDPLFVMRLTHEDVVQAQTEFLKTLEALDVEAAEIARLKTVTRGVVAGKVVLEREYERRKLEGLLKAQREALRLHGLEESQVARIASDRSLIREIRILVPEPHDPAEPDHGTRHDALVREAMEERRAEPGVRGRRISFQEPADSIENENHRPLTVERLTAHGGDAVEANAPLAELSDLSLLYVEGRAFERDAAVVAAAARDGRTVTALPTDSLGTDAEPIRDLEIAYVANRVGETSRALPFYVLLPNEVVRDSETSRGRFLTWRYKPGQRMRLRVPVETYEDAIVLPVDGVAEAGAERYAFVENGATFERRPVRVLYRDAGRVVIADDGSLLPGESVAVTAAHQLQMALKNAAGGAVDPHAGHNH